MAGELWVFPPNPGPRIPPAPFRIDPRVGTPTAPQVGDLVRLRGVGRGGPPNTGYGHVNVIGGLGGPESISIIIDQIGGGTSNVIFDYWDVGTPAPGSQLMLEQLFREKQGLPTNMASLIGRFAGTSNPNSIPQSDQAGYRTGHSITNARLPPRNEKKRRKHRTRKHRTRKHRTRKH